MIKGSKVRAKLRHLVDEDDNGVARYAEQGEEGVVTLLNHRAVGGDFLNYRIEFPRTGAMGFYDPAEVREHFEIVG